MKRRQVLEAGLGAAGVHLSASRSMAAKGSRMSKFWVFVGTNTVRGSEGIYRFSFDTETGQAGPVELAATTENPTWISPDPSFRFLYGVNAIGNYQGGTTGAVSGFALDRGSGKLSFINQASSGGAGPCHLTIDSRTRALLVANYGGGSVASLSIDSQGKLSGPVSRFQHAGGSVNPSRQEGPHAHSINLDAAEKFAFAADLGLDRILIYEFDANSATLRPHQPAFASTAPGAGPRHFAFHPSGKFAYVINELDSTITAFSYDASRGALEEIQVIPTLPMGYTDQNYPAEVQVHASGRFVFGSNRGHDSIAIYRVDTETGRLSVVDHQHTSGRWPRNFGQAPGGKWMIAGNNNTDNILIYHLDDASGRLKATGQTLACPAPICFKFVPVA